MPLVTIRQRLSHYSGCIRQSEHQFEGGSSVYNNVRSTTLCLLAKACRCAARVGGPPIIPLPPVARPEVFLRLPVLEIQGFIVTSPFLAGHVGSSSLELRRDEVRALDGAKATMPELAEWVIESDIVVSFRRLTGCSSLPLVVASPDDARTLSASRSQSEGWSLLSLQFPTALTSA